MLQGKVLKCAAYRFFDESAKIDFSHTIVQQFIVIINE